ncbi:DegT/DnrJ/EryC1/StrS aminotransferase family protein, partial [candidate division WOR-3 bacterium]|nr:DegT/DnrJ/EryC1/StrS aminotransferase family protein [candidate division WOR-3 bacterium]
MKAKTMKVEFYRHSLGEAEKTAVLAVLDGLFLTTGPLTRAFEQTFAALFGARHCVGLSSCSAGLFLTLKGWGIGQGDKVVVPAMTFVATANAVLHTGAEVVFCDVDPKTGLIDLEQASNLLWRNRTIRAVIPVHLYGQMVDMKALRAIADQYHAKILEDAAHCVEGERDGIRPSVFGDAAAFSFYATKNLTCGEGGAVATGDPQLAEYLAQARLHGMSQSALERHAHYQHWDMDFPGYKANMSDIQAALLIPQLGGIRQRLARREEIARRYEEAFAAAGVEFPETVPLATHARHVFTIWAPDGRRDELLARLQADGVGVVVNYRPVHLTSFYRRCYGCCEGMFPAAETIGRRTVSLPLYPGLTDAEVDYVCRSVIR